MILKVSQFLIRYKERYSVSPTKPRGHVSGHDIFSVRSEEDTTDVMSPSTSGRRVRQRRNCNSDLESATSNDLSGLVSATHADEVEVDAENDFVVDITPPEARRLNDG